jgi:hypothetical protein
MKGSAAGSSVRGRVASSSSFSSSSRPLLLLLLLFVFCPHRERTTTVSSSMSSSSFFFVVEARGTSSSTARAHDHDRLPGWHGEIHSVNDALAEARTKRRERACLDAIHRRVSSLPSSSSSSLKCEAEATIATALRANSFASSFSSSGGGEEKARDDDDDFDDDDLNAGKRSKLWCPGEAVSLYDPENSSKGNYKHMAMVETIPWKGPALGNVLLAWQTSEKIEGTKQRIVMAEADGKEERLKFKALTGNEQRKIFADVGSYAVPTDAGENGAVWGPSLFANPRKNHEIWLFYSQSRTGGCGSRVPGMDYAPGGDILAKTFNVVSGTWTHTEKIVLSQDYDDGIPKVTANKPIVLRRSGRWVLPYWNERAMIESPAANPDCGKLNGKEGAGVLLSDDHGESWYPSETIRGKNTWLIENAVVELEEDDHLLMVFRTKAGYVFRSESLDGGQTWTEATPMRDVPNPNSKIDMIRLQPSGLLALAFNDHAKHPAKGCSRCRTFLKVALSSDEGKTWTRIRELEMDVDGSLRSHYPTLLQRGCELLVAYSKFYKIEPTGARADESLAKQGIYVARVPLV